MSSDSILLYFPWIEDATPWAKSSNGHAKKPKSNGSGTVLGKSWEISWHRNWNLVFMYTHAAHSAWIEKSPRQFEVIHSDLHESWPGEYKNGPLLGEFCENHSHPSSRDSRRSPVNTTGLPGPRCFNCGCGSLPVLWFLHVATAVYPLIVIIWFKTPPQKKEHGSKCPFRILSESWKTLETQLGPKTQWPRAKALAKLLASRCSSDLIVSASTLRLEQFEHPSYRDWAVQKPTKWDVFQPLNDGQNFSLMNLPTLFIPLEKPLTLASKSPLPTVTPCITSVLTANRFKIGYSNLLGSPHALTAPTLRLQWMFSHPKIGIPHYQLDFTGW